MALHSSITHIPFGVFLTKENVVTVGTRIGDFAIDLGALQQLNYFEGIELTDDMFMQDTLNDFISDGKKTWRLVRNRIGDIFDSNNPKLRDNEKHRDIIIFNIDEVEMQLPVLIGDYTEDAEFRAGFQQWVNQLWQRKDDLIESMKSTGKN